MKRLLLSTTLCVVFLFSIQSSFALLTTAKKYCFLRAETKCIVEGTQCVYSNVMEYEENSKELLALEFKKLLRVEYPNKEFKVNTACISFVFDSKEEAEKELSRCMAEALKEKKKVATLRNIN